MRAPLRHAFAAILGASSVGRVAQAQVDCGPRSYGHPTAGLSDCVCNLPAFVRVMRDGSPTCRPAPAAPPDPQGLPAALSEVRPSPSRPPLRPPLRPPARSSVRAASSRLDVRPAAGVPASAIGWVPVPSGEFTMGEGDEAHRVRVSAFEIMRTEVTVAQYAGCLDAGACTALLPITDPECNGLRASRGGYPVNCVRWDQSQSFCRWAGGRLPTEAEWEFAARGTDGRLYPWGVGAPGRQICWSYGGGTHGTCPVGSRLANASPFGALDMVGNASEWVADWYGPYVVRAAVAVDPVGPAQGTTRVIRGRSWSTPSGSWMTAVGRNGWPAAVPESEIGVRCARGSGPGLQAP